MMNPKLVPLSQIFASQYGTNLELVSQEKCHMTDKGAVPFVSRTSKNNGLVAFVKRVNSIPPNPAGTLSLAVSGSVMSAFFQPQPYYSGRDIYVLSPQRPMGSVELIMYSKYIQSNESLYSFGRGANKTFRNILLPSVIPLSVLSKWEKCFEENLSGISKQPLSTQTYSLDPSAWGEFKIIDLFEVTGSKTVPLQKIRSHTPQTADKYPYVTTRTENNGVSIFRPSYSESGNVIVVESAVTGHSSYQATHFSASDHVEKLIPKFELNKYIALFLVTVLNKEKYRYNFGLKASQTRLRTASIKLPVDKTNNPDWHFMENYIKSLPYSQNL